MSKKSNKKKLKVRSSNVRTSKISVAAKFHKKGDLESAKNICQSILAKDPTNAEANHLLAVIAMGVGNLTAARQLFERSIQAAPDNADVIYDLALLFESIGDMRSALDAFRRCIQIQPSHRAGPRFGRHLNKIGYKYDAIAAFNLALHFEPNNPGHYVDRGLAQHGAGELEAAIETYEKALELDPNFRLAIGNLLLAQHYVSRLNPDALFIDHKRLAMRMVTESDNCTPLTNISARNKIRVAYISPDLHKHPITDFFVPLFDNHDRDKFEIYCYYNNNLDDELTQMLIEKSDKWTKVYGLSDIEVLEILRKDELDILVDLSGHMGGNRLSVFGYKAAPIQVTWLGYPNTTGIEQIDYRFVDDVVDPEGKADDIHSEKLIRLPRGFLCYRCAENTKLGDKAPFETNGFITFGSFNNLSKVNPEVILVWARLLNRVENSKIVLKYHTFIDPRIKQKFIQLFEATGISMDRVILLDPNADKSVHLEKYNEIDIALDTFPYNGTTTSCEALWMGVPLITMQGESHVSRVSSSILHRVGLDDLVGNDIEDYIDKAAKLAEDQSYIAKLKTELRATMLNSDLCDGKMFAQQIEAAYVDMMHTLKLDGVKQTV